MRRPTGVVAFVMIPWGGASSRWKCLAMLETRLVALSLFPLLPHESREFHGVLGGGIAEGAFADLLRVIL